MVFGAVLAGGSGTRMAGTAVPKQYLPLGGKPVFVRTVEKFTSSALFDALVVLVPVAWVERTRELLCEYLPDEAEEIAVIPGGALRSDTLVNALEYFETKFGLDDDSVIVTHDAVRPFINDRILRDNIEFVRKYGGCDTVIPATDTIVRSTDGEVIAEIPRRSEYYQGQTPQSFKAKRLLELCRALTPEQNAILTDACMVYSLMGERVALVNGETTNIKITYPGDIAVAEALLRNDDSL